MILIPEDISLFRIVRYGFKYSGLMYFEGKAWSTIALMYHWIMHTCFGVLCVLEITMGSGRLMDRIEILSVITAYFLTFPKLYVMSTRARAIRQLFHRLEDIHNKMSKDAENTEYKNILRNAENIGKTLVVLFGMNELFTPFLLFTFKNIHQYFNNYENRNFIVQIYIPWSTDELWAYILADVFVTLMIFTCCMAVAVIAGVELTFTFQISACLKVLQSYFETKGPADQIIYEYHDTLIQIINEFNKIFSGALYVETICASLIPCGCAMTMIWTIRKQNYDQLAPNIIKIFGCMFLFIIALSCGQEINTQVEKLHESSYMNKWYEETPKVRRDLLTLMIRSTKPTTVNYRLFVTFNRECLASVLQGLYSFLTIVINFDSSS